MADTKAFPDGTDLMRTLEFYFQNCALLSNADQLSIVAASLANGGINPLTGEKIFSPQTVRN